MIMDIYVNNCKPAILVYAKEKAILLKILSSEHHVEFCSDKKNFTEKTGMVKPDLIIINSGISEMIDLLDESTDLHNIPVIAITDLNEDIIKDYLHRGIIDSFLPDPVNPLTLVQTIKILLNLSRSQKEIFNREKENLVLKTFREDILRIIIHDMGNSISGVVGSIDLLKLLTGNFTEKQSKHLVRANESAKELLQIIKNIGDISQSGEDNYRYQIQKVDISRLLHQIKSELDDFFTYNKRNLVIEIPENLPHVKGQEELLKRLIESLINNAIKNTSAMGQVTVRINLPEDKTFLEVRVIDHGRSLPKEYRKKIFKFYGQLEIFDAGYRFGRGFSMTFCKFAVDKIGGQIWMEDIKEEKGNIIVFTVPLA
jgi:K+-sensing histidine kinase KdpD